MEISLPYRFNYRRYQQNIAEGLDKFKRLFFLHHRRAGKDIACWNVMIEKATEKVGLYWYVLPTYSQAKKTLWDAITNDGETFFDFIPPEIIASKNNSEMKLTLVNGSIIQVVGSDRYDNLRGANPQGVVLSEFAFHHPIFWQKIVKPILKANKGWAIFNSTPNGDNHAKELYEMAMDNLDWFTEMLTIDDTGLLTEEDMEVERLEGTDEDTIQQEYYCSFSSSTKGAIYGEQYKKMDEEDRITLLPYDKKYPVSVWTDLGKSDATTFLFFQFVGKAVRLIDAYTNVGLEVDDYCDILDGKEYKYKFLYMPHDAYHERMGASKTIAKQFEGRGFRVKPVPKLKIATGIALGRKVFKHLIMDDVKTKDFRLAIKNYKYKYDILKKIYSREPEHDWTSHYADAFRYFAVCYDDKDLDVSSHGHRVRVLEQGLNHKPIRQRKITMQGRRLL